MFRTSLIVSVFSIFLIPAFPSPAYAWSEFGHLTVCDLAYRNTTKKTREELDKLFQVDSGGIEIKNRDGTIDRWYTSFNIGCLEEDHRPRKHPKDHFLNVPRDTKEILVGACPGTTSCIFEGIERDLGILADTSKSNEDRVFALMAIGHWIGDLHQPLHVSFKDDQGGNLIDVKLTGKCGTARRKPRKLHAMWDFCLLESGLFERVRQSPTFRDGWSRTTITYRAVDMLQDATTLKEEINIVKGTPEGWANESYQVTLNPDVRYCVMSGSNCNYSASHQKYGSSHKRKLELKQDYLRKFENTAQERARYAGIRLAHLINDALDPDYEKPIQNSTQKLE